MNLPHSSKELFTAAFYNLENLFDFQNDQKTLDDDYTPEGKRNWTKARYTSKIKKLTSVIAQIGADKVNYAPAFIGISEVENESVVKDLVNSKALKPFNFGYVHTDSEDERGIEVAFLYRKSIFELTSSSSHPLLLVDERGIRDYTRDVLHIEGRLAGKTVHVIVNHWPSRRTGTGYTDEKRVAAAHLVQTIIADILNADPNAQLMIMGDFNDGPFDNSIQQLKKETLFNPYEQIKEQGRGSATHQRQWFLFDQILMSHNFNTGTQLQFMEADIYNKYFLTEYKGKRKGNPFRTYLGKKHQGGYSDHFPVYVVLSEG